MVQERLTYCPHNTHICTHHIHLQPNWAGSASEQTPSESIVTSEDEAVRSKPPLPQSTSMGFDYVEPVHSASSVSTPPASSIPDDPFASDNLGDTVIKLDKVSVVQSPWGGFEGTLLEFIYPLVSFCFVVLLGRCNIHSYMYIYIYMLFLMKGT